MGADYAAAHGVFSNGILGIPASNCWQPATWLMLLFCVTCAVAIVALLGSPNDSKKLAISACDEDAEALDAKYESFFSGEEAVYSQVGGSDLFWGFKHNWRKYFSFMHDWHSGIVNDYTLYGAVAIAFVLLACVILL